MLKRRKVKTNIEHKIRKLLGQRFYNESQLGMYLLLFRIKVGVTHEQNREMCFSLSHNIKYKLLQSCFENFYFTSPMAIVIREQTPFDANLII